MAERGWSGGTTPVGSRVLRQSAGAAVLLAGLLLAGCAGDPVPVSSGRGAVDRSCSAAGPVEPGLLDLVSLPEDERQAIATSLAAHGYPESAIGMASIIGALSELRDLTVAEAGTGPGAALRWLRLRQVLTERVLLVMLDVSATLAKIDCEGERGDQLRDRLQRADTAQVRRLGLAGVMLGAATAALTGGLSLAGAGGGDIVGIIGGTAEAAVSGSVLFIGSSSEFRTPHNMLAEIHDRPDRSAVFPPVVWRYLMRDGPESSPAATLAADWATIDRTRFALVTGPGGRYTVEDLEARDAMLDLLETNVARMSQELRSLLSALLVRPEPRLRR
jgi:hypothetical protein